MKVFINEIESKVIPFEKGSFSIASASCGVVDVRVDFEKTVTHAVVRPLRLGIKTEIDGSKVSFKVDLKDFLKISVEANEDIHDALLLFLNTSERVAQENVDLVLGQDGDDVGRVVLESNQTVCINEGRILNGWFYAEDKKNIKLCGSGAIEMPILDNYHSNRFCLLVGCENVEIRDLTFFGARTWNIVLIDCKNVLIDGVNIISFYSTGDGIDVCGSENVKIQNCFLRTADDCVALKAVSYDNDRACKSVRDVTVTKCVCWNAEPGNALEIGFETRGDVFENVLFEDIDIIHCEREGWQSGGTFTIHNGDRALVRNVLYNDIRVEDAQEKLFDLKVLHSKYSRDDKRGDIRDITFRNIQVVDGKLPPSIIRGYEDGEHYIENVVFENLTYMGKKIDNFMDAHMIVELTRDIKFK